MKKILLLILFLPFVSAALPGYMEDNLQYCFDFEDTSSELIDVINGTNGVIIGTPVNISGIIGNALNMTGASNYINMSNSDFPLDYPNGTFSIWAKEGKNSAGFMFGIDVVGRDSGDFYLQAHVPFAGQYVTDDGTTQFVLSGNGTGQENVWGHYIVTWGSAGTYLFRNNVLVAFDATTDTPSPNQAWHIGVLGVTFQDFFGGLDEFMIWDRRLNSTEISKLFNSGSGETCSFPAVDSCTYTSGNWVVDCADNCSIDSNVAGDGSNFSCIGTGTFTINANISGFNRYTFGGQCTATCTSSAGCIRI